jgi:acetylornithine deacetylase/succinyl-diaminopimelate desuccinylase-like protein
MRVNQPRLKKLLLDLIRIQSTWKNEHEIATYIFNKLKPIADQVEYQEVPGCGPNVIGNFFGKDEGPTMLFNAHMDTVKVFKGWRRNHRGEEVGDRIYGLGACNMKAGLTAMIEALYCLKDSGVKLKGNLIFTAVSDEEGFSRGTYQLIQSNRLSKVDFGIISEHSGLDIEIGAGGRLVFDVHVRGLSAHAAEMEGVNAIVEQSKIALHLTEMPMEHNEKYDAKGKLTVLYTESSKPSLSVPDYSLLRVDRHYLPGKTKEEIIEEFREFVNSTRNLKANVEIDLMKRPTPFMEPFLLSEDESVVETVKKTAREVLGRVPACFIGLSVNDANYLNNIANIPTVCYGPSGANIHSPDEYVEFSSVVDASRIYFQIVENILT